jgi:hypothetical protein
VLDLNWPWLLVDETKALGWIIDGCMQSIKRNGHWVKCCVNWWGASIMVEIHPTIEIHKRFPPSTPHYSPIDLCHTSEIYFCPQNFIPNWCCHIRILNNIHSMEVHPMGSDSHINIHFIRWMKSIHHGSR